MALMNPCIEPDDPGMVLELMREGRGDDAAVAHARYVLDVRDAFEICNGHLKSLREWCETMSSIGGLSNEQQ